MTTLNSRQNHQELYLLQSFQGVNIIGNIPGIFFKNFKVSLKFHGIVPSSVYWTSTPSQNEIFYVIVGCCIYWPFKMNTPSESEIFQVIVASVYWTSTLSKSEIFAVIVASVYWPLKTSTH